MIRMLQVTALLGAAVFGAVIFASTAEYSCQSSEPWRFAPSRVVFWWGDHVCEKLWPGRDWIADAKK